MEKLLEQALLYDFYGEMLTDYQKQMYEDFILNDFSLSEIAQDHGISRQGVHEIVKRCSKKLNGYEEKLHLIEKFMNTKKLAEQINTCAGMILQDSRNDLEKHVKMIEEISAKIVDDM